MADFTGEHLAAFRAALVARRYGGFRGPEGFTRASQSLKFMLNELGIS